MKKIAVVGATGNTGRAAVNELRALGEKPLSVVRNTEKALNVHGALTLILRLRTPTIARRSRRH
jgi:putative NADH-flavin reductase